MMYVFLFNTAKCQPSRLTNLKFRQRDQVDETIVNALEAWRSELKVRYAAIGLTSIEKS